MREGITVTVKTGYFDMGWPTGEGGREGGGRKSGVVFESATFLEKVGQKKYGSEFILAPQKGIQPTPYLPTKYKPLSFFEKERCTQHEMH